jgi:hypothetical protein
MNLRSRPVVFLLFAALQLTLFGAVPRAGARVDATTSLAPLPNDSHNTAHYGKAGPSDNLQRRLPAMVFTMATAIAISLPFATIEPPLAIIVAANTGTRVLRPHSRAPPILS